MKSRIIIFSLFLAFILENKISVAQSKSETENWLISIIEDPEYSYNAYVRWS
jgi:hypothetical protein